LSDVFPCAEPGIFHTFAVGNGSDCEDDPRHTGSLQDIADLGGGTCTKIGDPNSLAAVLGGGLRPEITRVTLAVNGGAAVDVSDSVAEALPHDGEGTLHFSREIAGLTGDDELCLTAYAAVDGVESSVTECVSTFENAAPVADAGPDQAVDEGTLVALDGSASSDPDGDALTWQWALVGIDGPPLVIPGEILPSTVVQTLDDGTYTFELTVSDGALSASDTVTVVVGNAPPVAQALLDGAATGGLALLTASFTDPGIVDTHTATVDWGDGIVEPIAISAQGTGWGSLYAAHS
jgi:hypothetical protein